MVNLVQVYSRGYVPCILKNPSKLNLFLDAELLVDCGASIDLILPTREIEKLQLKQVTSGIAARSFNNVISILPQYEDVKIIINLKHAVTGQITTKSAIVSVFERKSPSTVDAGLQCSDDNLQNETQPTNTNYSNLITPPRNTQAISTANLINDDSQANVSILKLSPLKSPLASTDRYGILGYPAMMKMNIGIHFGGNYIFSIERLFEYISTVSVLMND